MFKDFIIAVFVTLWMNAIDFFDIRNRVEIVLVVLGVFLIAMWIDGTAERIFGNAKKDIVTCDHTVAGLREYKRRDKSN